MKDREGTTRGFGVIVSALCASLVSAIYTAGIVSGCRATSCDESRWSIMPFFYLVPLGALTAGPILAARIARTSVSPLWLAVGSSALPVATAFLSVVVAAPADVSEDFGFAVGFGMGLAMLLAPIAGIVTAWRYKKRVEGGPGFGVIVSALCAALAAASYAAGYVVGCRATSCEPEGPEILFFSPFLVPLGALVAAPILAAQVARTSGCPPWLAVCSFVLPVATAMLGVRAELPADAGYVFPLMAGFGVGLAVLLAPIAELVNQWRHKERIEAGSVSV